MKSKTLSVIPSTHLCTVFFVSFLHMSLKFWILSQTISEKRPLWLDFFDPLSRSFEIALRLGLTHINVIFFYFWERINNLLLLWERNNKQKKFKGVFPIGILNLNLNEFVDPFSLSTGESLLIKLACFSDTALICSNCKDILKKLFYLY
jgi:undecaprenyl pyrophosphate phosphatase UppP